MNLVRATAVSYTHLDVYKRQVHIAPAFGEDDAKVGRKYGLPLVQLVDGKGCLLYTSRCV